MAAGGLSAFAGTNGATGAGYESIFGPAAAPYAEGNSPQALAVNYGHTRLYLTSGNGNNCPQDPHGPTGLPLDAATERSSTASRARSPPPSAPRAPT